MSRLTPTDSDPQISGRAVHSAPDPSTVWRLVMLLFLASLAMLFAASLVGYVNIRLMHPQVRLNMPVELWISTLCLGLGAVAAHGVWMAAGSGRLEGLRMRLGLLGLTSLAFLMVQTPALSGLLKTHWEMLEAVPDRPMAMYGLVFAVILIHALHVVGGLVPLGWQLARVLRGRLEPRHLPGIRALVLYWHFLEAVWVVLFATLLWVN